MTFLGNAEPKVDDKGRLFIPARFREELAGGVVMTRGHEHCLYLFPKDEFFELADRWRAAPMSNKGARDYLRAFLSGSSVEIPDRQGRITIPPALRAFAELGKDTVLSGQLDKLELWARERYESYIADIEPVFAEANEEVLPGLF